MAAPDTALEHVTQCRVCGKQFLNYQMDVPIIGQPPAQRTAKFVATLMQHIHKKHGDKMAAITVGTQEFMGMLIMMLFSTTDPNLQATVGVVKQSVTFLCRDESAAPSDVTILDRAARIGLDPEHQELVVAMMKELRDKCYRIGAFAPQIQTIQP